MSGYNRVYGDPVNISEDIRLGADEETYNNNIIAQYYNIKAQYDKQKAKEQKAKEQKAMEERATYMPRSFEEKGREREAPRMVEEDKESWVNIYKTLLTSNYGTTNRPNRRILVNAAKAEAKRQAAAEQQGSGSRHKKPSVPQSKEILGKQRRIYKVAGSRKEHIKYKGQLIPVSDYKKLFKK